MAENPTESKDKVDQKLKTEDKNDSKNTPPSKNKKKKKPAAKAAPAQLVMDDEAFKQLLEQKFKELEQTGEVDKELKKINKKYKALATATPLNIFPGQDDVQKLTSLVDAYNQLLEANIFFEENSFIIEKLQGQVKTEKDLLQNELTKMGNMKANLEKFARDVQKNNAQIKDINKRFVEEETKRREEILSSFENTLNEITIKLDEQRLGAQEQGAENEKLKAEFKEKIEDYEKREKEFFSQIQVLDTKNDDRTKGVLGNLKTIEEGAKKAFEIKDKIQELKKQGAEDKLKVAIYSQRFGDLESTFNTTTEVLQKFKGELLRSGSRVKSLYQENKELKEKCEKIDGFTLEIYYLNQDLKKKIEQSKKEKDGLRDKCNAIQADVVAKTKQLQELEQKKATA